MKKRKIDEARRGETFFFVGVVLAVSPTTSLLNEIAGKKRGAGEKEKSTNCTSKQTQLEAKKTSTSRSTDILRHNKGANEAKKKVRNVGKESKLLGKDICMLYSSRKLKLYPTLFSAFFSWFAFITSA